MERTHWRDPGAGAISYKPGGVWHRPTFPTSLSSWHPVQVDLLTTARCSRVWLGGGPGLQPQPCRLRAVSMRDLHSRSSYSQSPCSSSPWAISLPFFFKNIF